MTRTTIAALALMSCDPTPATWIGIDWATASCSSDLDNDPDKRICVSDGQEFRCVRDRPPLVWQCARILR